jgi:predicted MFS family arabinose efflux permease
MEMETIMNAQIEKKKISSIAWVTVGIIWLGYIIVNLTTFSWGMMKLDVVSDLGLSERQFGMLGASSWILKAILSIPIVLLISKFNAKALLRGIFIVVAVGIFCQAAATNFEMIFLGRSLVYGVAGAVLAPLAVIKIKLIPQERMAEVNGFENFTAPAGQVLGTVAILSLIGFLGGWRNTLYLMGALVVLVIVLWSALCKKEYGITSKKQEKIAFLAPLKEACRHKEVWLLALGWPGTGFIWNVVYTHWPSFAQTNFGLTPGQTGFILGCLPVGSVIGSLISAKVANAIGYDKPMIWPWGIVLPLAYGGMMFSGNVAALCVLSFIAGFGAYIFVPIGFTTIYKIKGISPTAVSIGLAMIFTMNGLGGAMGSLLPPIMAEQMSMDLVMKICCLSPLLFAFLTLFLPERGRKAMEKEQ